MRSLLDRLSPRLAVPSPRDAGSRRDDRLRAVFAVAPVGLAVTNFEGRWILFNDAAAATLGYTRDALGRLTMHAITHPEDLARELAYVRRMSAGEGQRYQIAKRIVDQDGKERALTFTGAVVRGRGGDPDSIVYVIDPPVPRTESGRTSEVLSHAILDRLVETAVVRCDAQGTILGWNRGAEELFGYTREQVIGRNRDLLYADRAAAIDHLRLAAERRHYEGEDLRVTRHGREIHVRVAITPFAPEGAVRGFVEVMHAITYDEQYVAQLREQLQIERDSGATLTRVVEKLKARVQAEAARSAELEQELANLRATLARVETKSPSSEWASLAGRAPLDIVATCAREQRTGLLLFVSGARQKSVHLENGCICATSSGEIEQSLVDRLVRRGAITEAQRTKAIEISTATNVAMGRALVILGAMREQEVAAAVREKVDADLNDLHGWSEARWAFVERQPPRVKPVRVSLPLEELRQFASPEFVASRNGTRYHRASCAAMLRVRGEERTPIISALDGAERGLAPCRICIA